MTGDHFKAQQAAVWSRRFSMLYAFGVWTIIGFFVSRSVRFREKPPKEEEKGGQSPSPSPLGNKEEYSRSV